MAKKKYQESEEKSNQKTARQQQTGQQQEATPPAIDTHQILARFNQLIETQNKLLEIQVQHQAPQAVSAKAADAAADAFNNILADLQLKYIPDKPGEFKAKTVTSSKIDLSWTEPTNNPVGFMLERGEGAQSVNYTEIKRFRSDERNYSDTGLSPKTTYTYRLRAFNIKGASPHVETSATTQEDSAKS